jgi:hypothetical protein
MPDTSPRFLLTGAEGSVCRVSGRPRGRLLDRWSKERILYVTPGYRLIALDAKTCIPVLGFGHNGIVDLKLDDGSADRSGTHDVG